MRIEYLGHASFLITTNRGLRIVTDPVDSQEYPGTMMYSSFNEPADAITVSHDHPDHNSIGVVKGNPIIIKGIGKFAVKDVMFYGISTDHDPNSGAQRGKNTVFILEVDDIIVAHFGDLGHVLNADQAAQIGNVDIALLPVGGTYTIGPSEAHEVAEQVAANIVIPMHYSTSKCNFPIKGVEDFIDGMNNVVRLNSSVLEVTKENLPQSRQIIVLEPSL